MLSPNEDASNFLYLKEEENCRAWPILGTKACRLLHIHGRSGNLSLLIEAFPDGHDYYETLTRMVHRVKLPNESFTTYYYEKTALLNRCNILGPNAISCILGVIEDITVRTAAKASNPAASEDLLKFLRSCDITRSPYPRQSLLKAGHRRLNGRGKAPTTNTEKCYACGQAGHKATMCRQRKCYTCGQPGHRAVDCTRNPRPKLNKKHGQGDRAERVL